MVKTNSSALPVHPLADGVTTTEAVVGALPVFTDVKAARLPVPVVARPMEPLLLAHVYDVPLTGPENATGAVASPLQCTWSADAPTEGIGFTVIRNFSEVPAQLFADGVTVTVAVCGAVPLLVAANETMSPLPDEASPMVALLFVHAKLVPLTAPLKFTLLVIAP